MKTVRGALVFSMLALVCSTAYADALGGPCPSGQIFQENPAEPGAMHHAGGHCVDDPSASHCGVAPGGAREGSRAATVALGTLAAVTIRRRVRVPGR